MRITSKILVAVAAVLAMGQAFGGEIRWQDSVTGTRFMLLGERTWQQAYKICYDRGWDMFNFDYLTKDEQQRFLEADVLNFIYWTKKFRGEPGERSEAEIWGSSEMTGISSNMNGVSVSTLHLTQMAGKSVRRARISGGHSSDSPRVAMCMYQSDTWFGCSDELRCTSPGIGSNYTPPLGTTASFPTTISFRYSMYEWGPTRDVAYGRITDRATKVSAKDPNCSLSGRPHCVTIR
jgi:hypothetical protein